MRLIDADMLLTMIKNSYQYREIAQWIDNIPTIKLEQKRGEWIDDGEKYGKRIWHCSRCKVSEAVPTTTSFVTGVLYPQWMFCPNCGAKMKDDTEKPILD